MRRQKRQGQLDVMQLKRLTENLVKMFNFEIYDLKPYPNMEADTLAFPV